MQRAGGLAIASYGRVEAPTGDPDDLVDHASSDLARDVYCVFGAPIDATDMAATLRRINQASTNVRANTDLDGESEFSGEQSG